jgi:hypothetical protein
MPTLAPRISVISVGGPFFKLISLVHQKFSNNQKKSLLVLLLLEFLRLKVWRKT